jgi:hypothetical protein
VWLRDTDSKEKFGGQLCSKGKTKALPGGGVGQIFDFFSGACCPA